MEIVLDRKPGQNDAPVQKAVGNRTGVWTSVSVQHKKAVRFSAVVDALFGVGLSRMVEGSYAELLSEMNGLCGTKVAVDMPSGISSDTGAVLGTAIPCRCYSYFWL